MPHMVDVTFFCQAARLSSMRPDLPALNYQLVTRLDVTGMGSLYTSLRWPIMQRIVPSGKQTHLTVQFEQGQAERLHQCADRYFAQGISGLTSFGLTEFMLGQSINFYSGKVEVDDVDPTLVTAGMPCAVVGRRLQLLGGFIGLGPNLGLTYGRRSTGPAILPIDQLVRFCEGTAIVRILGLQRSAK